MVNYLLENFNDYFINNEYFYQYVELIKNNIDKKEIKFKTQNHHIIPRHYYTHKHLQIDDTSKNLIVLEYKDHIKAHYLLSLCSKSNFKYFNECALMLLLHKDNIDNIQEIINHLDEYQNLYEDFCKQNSEFHKGKPSKFKGVKGWFHHDTSQETKDKISKANKGKYTNHIWINKNGKNKHIDKLQVSNYLEDGWSLGRNDPEAFRKISEIQKLNPNKSMLGKKHSDETKLKMSNSAKGKKKSPEHIAKIAQSRIGKICVSNESLKISKYIDKENLDDYLNNGYHRGRLNK